MEAQSRFLRPHRLVPDMGAFSFSVRLAVFLAACLFALLAHGQPAIGVNRPQLTWLHIEDGKRTLDAIQKAGFKDVRFMLVTPFDRFVQLVRHANASGMNVLPILPLTLQIYYADGTSLREGNKAGPIFTLPPLSKLSLEKFERHWRDAFGQMERAGVRISAVQVENEFNSGPFNGDLPLLKGGAILTRDNYQNFDFWPQYVAGMKNLVQALRIVRTSLHSSTFYKDTPVVLGGLARPSANWIRNVNTVLVEPDLALKTLLDLGAGEYVDAFAIHLYPLVPRGEWQDPGAVVARYVEERLAQVTSVPGPAMPIWVTEWGFAIWREVPRRNDQPDPRLPLFQALPQALAQSRFAARLGPTYIYDWDENGAFRIWNDGKVLGVDNALNQLGARGSKR